MEGDWPSQGMKCLDGGPLFPLCGSEENKVSSRRGVHHSFSRRLLLPLLLRTEASSRSTACGAKIHVEGREEGRDGSGRVFGSPIGCRSVLRQEEAIVASSRMVMEKSSHPSIIPPRAAKTTGKRGGWTMRGRLLPFTVPSPSLFFRPFFSKCFFSLAFFCCSPASGLPLLSLLSSHTKQ